MCTTFRTLSPAYIRAIFRTDVSGLPDMFTARTGDAVPIIKAQGTEYKAQTCTFGYPNAYGVQPNARSETWRVTPLWHDSMRCIIPAKGWYEHGVWISGTNAEPLPFAGIYRNGQCAVLTMNSVPSIARLHPRQPVVLTLDGIPAWLQRDELIVRSEFKQWS